MGNFTPAGIEYLVKNFSKGMSDLNKLDKSQQNLGKSAGSAAKQFTGLGKGVLSIGAIAGGAAVAGVGALGVAVGGLGVASVKTAISFESAFAGVLKTTDGLTDSIGNLNIAGQELRKGFVDLSKEVPLAFEELAQIGELGGQLGIGKDALIEFTESVAALGVSTNLSTEEAASGLARMSNIFNVSSEDMGNNITRLGSSIVDLGNNFATTERDILAMGERMAGAGAIAGLTQADILGIGAAMSSVGVQAEAGGTAVQKVLLAINGAVVGTTTGFVDNTKAIEKNVNRLTSLNGKLVALESKVGLTGEQILQMRDEFIAAGGSAEEFGRQLGETGRRRLFETAIAVRDLKDETQLLRELQGQPIDDGQLETFARTAGLSADEFKEAWETDASSAFQLFVEGLGKQGDNAINTLEELGLTDQRLIRAFLSLSGAGDLLGETLDTANSAFEENTALADEAAKRYATTESQLLILKNTLRAIGDTIGSRFLPVLNKIITVGKGLIEKWADPLAKILDEKVIPAIKSVISFVEEFINKLSGVDAETLNLFGGIAAVEPGGINTAFAFLQETILNAWNTFILPTLNQLALTFWNWITETAIPTAQQKIPLIFNSILLFINENWPKVVEKMTELSNSFFDWVNKSIIPKIPEVFTSIISGITTFLTENWPQIQETLNSWRDLFWTWVEGVISRAGETLSGILAAIGQWALSSETQQQLTDFGIAIGENLVTGINNLISDQGRMVEILTKIATGLAIGIGAVVGLLIIVGGQIVAGILEGVLESLTGGDFEAATFNELGGILTGIADNAWTAAKLIGVNIIEGISQGILDTIDQLLTTLEQLGVIISETVKSTLGISSPSTVFMEFGKNIIQGLISGIQSLAGNVVDIISSIFGGGSVGGDFEIDLTIFSQTLPEVMATNITLIESMMTSLQGLVVALGTPIQTAIKKFQEAMKTGFSLVFTQLDSIVKTINLMITKLLPNLALSTLDTTTEMEDALSKVSDIFTDISGAITSAANAVLTMNSALVTFGSKLDLASSSVDRLKSKVSSLTDKIGSLREKTKGAAESFDQFVTARDRVSEVATAMERIVSALDAIVDKAGAANAALADMKIPKDLQPGSPSPFETSVTGINQQLDGFISRLGAISIISGGGGVSNTISTTNQVFNISIGGGEGRMGEGQMALMIRQNVQRQLGTV